MPAGRVLSRICMHASREDLALLPTLVIRGHLWVLLDLRFAFEQLVDALAYISRRSPLFEYI
jgi:hypothetical protein